MLVSSTIPSDLSIMIIIIIKGIYTFTTQGGSAGQAPD